MYLQFYFQSLWKMQFQSDPLYNIVASIVRSYVVLSCRSHMRVTVSTESEKDVRITILQFDYLNIIQVLGVNSIEIKADTVTSAPLPVTTVARLSAEYYFRDPWMACYVGE